jgi:HEPN domain-containing protein
LLLPGIYCFWVSGHEGGARELNDKVNYWLELAEYDLETARIMLRSRRYLYVGFMCHQVIEKVLKAYYVQAKGKMPPYTHNLELLAAESALSGELSDEQIAHMRQIEPLNVESRYPADRELLAKALTPKKCRSILRATEDFYEWIRKRL